MSSTRENLPTVDGIVTQLSTENESSHFRRRILSGRRFVCPRRYVMALLLLVALLIDVARNWTISKYLVYAILSNDSKKKTEYRSMQSWTYKELETYSFFVKIVGAIVNIFGGVLIYKFSSHKFLLVCMTASSILHTLMPTALSHHSIAFLLFVLISQEILSAPMYMIVLSIWKDWAPPCERTRLVAISLFGIIEAFSVVNFFLIDVKTTSYFIGAAGLVWALLWYNITSSSPKSDPLITEKEYLYLESNIPSDYQESTALKDIPWKCIYKSKQIFIMCFLFFKLGASVVSIHSNIMLFLVLMMDTMNPLVLVIPFFVSFTFVYYGSSFLMDLLLQKYRHKALMIRKTFVCSGLVMQSVILLSSVGLSSVMTRALLFILAYTCLAFSIPGFLRYPLDLSPRYVSIVAGAAFASYYFGQEYLFEMYPTLVNFRDSVTEVYVSISEIVISLLAAVVFCVWGDTEEQPWSFLTSSQRRGNDYKSYPQPDDEDFENLSPGTA